MPRVTNDREPCPARSNSPHLWEGIDPILCHYCGAERVSQWIPTEADIANNRRERE